MIYRETGLEYWNNDEEIKLLHEFYSVGQTLERRIMIDNIRADRAVLGEKMVWIAAAGGVFAIFGVGMLLSAKPASSS